MYRIPSVLGSGLVSCRSSERAGKSKLLTIKLWYIARRELRFEYFNILANEFNCLAAFVQFGLMWSLNVICLSSVMPNTLKQRCDVITMLASNVNSTWSSGGDGKIMNWDLSKLAFLPLTIQQHDSNPCATWIRLPRVKVPNPIESYNQHSYRGCTFYGEKNHVLYEYVQ